MPEIMVVLFLLPLVYLEKVYVTLFPRGNYIEQIHRNLESKDGRFWLA